ncbi:SpoIIE family protein phosphatase [Streptomyces sp. 8N616]|uniref:SpoIIE family protein phosphatase n=1 Tax=Streptomyces sp. 8N616 TaxID=3457414 RepID=UPI003FD5712D
MDEFAFPGGAALLLFTDGVTEARNAEGAFCDPGERLRGRRLPGPDALPDALVADVRRHAAGGVPDGMAMPAVTRPASYVP